MSRIAPLLLTLLVLLFSPSIDASPPDELIQKGIQAVERGDFNAAKDLLSQAARARPKDAELHYSLGVVALQARDAVTALAAFQRTIALAPKHADARFNLGKLLGALGKTREAARHLRYHAKMNPKDPSPLLELATAHLAAGQLKHARAVLKEIRPSTADVRSLQAFVELRDAQWSTALEHARAALDAAPDGLRHQLVHNLALVHAGRQREAIPRLYRLLRNGPRTQANLPYTMALAMFLDGNAGDARRWMVEAVARAPEAFEPARKGFDPMAFPTPSDVALLRWYKASPKMLTKREALLKDLVLEATTTRRCHRGPVMAPLLNQASTLQGCLGTTQTSIQISGRADSQLHQLTISPGGPVAKCIHQVLDKLPLSPGAAHCKMRLQLEPAP